MSKNPQTVDINADFRGGGRAIEWLDEINKACIVMLAESGIVPREVAARIATGIARLIEDEKTGSHDTEPRVSADYLDYEPRLIALVGPEASRLHTGRSRQDLSSTIARMNLRDQLLQVSQAVNCARESLLERAEEHIETIIPAYTHGVQAQPTTFAHYLLAFESALGRAAERLQQVHDRVNRSPLGTAALATSSFALDRHRLAALLGFDGLVQNAYDANHLAPIDSALEVAGAYSILMVTTGMFAQDIHTQYSEPRPWFTLGGSRLTGTSSIMPQKRNPAALEQLRAQSSIALSELQAMTWISHNNRTGMFDYRMYDPVPAKRTLKVLDILKQVLGAIVVDKARALEEVRADYSTTTEIADALLQKAEVPFRIGHHFASQLTDYGRSLGMRLQEIPFTEARRIYREQTQSELPLTDTEFHETISAEYMVFGRRGLGGPQVTEARRMLANSRQLVASSATWCTERIEHRARGVTATDAAFRGILGSGT